MPDLKLLFQDLTQLGLPKSQFSLINDETSYNYNPDRYNFYVNLLDNVSDPDQKIASKVFGILARNRRQHERIQEKIDHIASAINYLRSVYTKPDDIGGERNMNELEILKRDLNSNLLAKPIVNTKYEFDTDIEKVEDVEQNIPMKEEEEEEEKKEGVVENIEEDTTDQENDKKKQEDDERARLAAEEEERRKREQEEADRMKREQEEADRKERMEGEIARLNQEAVDLKNELANAKKDLTEPGNKTKEELDKARKQIKDLEEALKAAEKAKAAAEQAARDAVAARDATARDTAAREEEKRKKKEEEAAREEEKRKKKEEEAAKEAERRKKEEEEATKEAERRRKKEEEAAKEAERRKKEEEEATKEAERRKKKEEEAAAAVTSNIYTKESLKKSDSEKVIAMKKIDKEVSNNKDNIKLKGYIYLLNTIKKVIYEQRVYIESLIKSFQWQNDRKTIEKLRKNDLRFQNINNVIQKLGNKTLKEKIKELFKLVIENNIISRDLLNKSYISDEALKNIYNFNDDEIKQINNYKVNENYSRPNTPVKKGGDEEWYGNGGEAPFDIIRQIGGSYFNERLNELNKIKEKQYNTRKDREAAEDDVVVEYKNNPLYSPELENATYTDRIIFIAVTFMFRAISLVLVQSAINTQFITTFNQAFTYYFLIYSILFIIWVLIVNMRKDSYIVGLLFYYVNANYNSSIWLNRIAVHLLLQLLILPIPILLTPKFTSKTETDSFEKRERLYNTLTFFTFVIWIITSLIALRA